MLVDCNLSVGLAMARKVCSLMIESKAPVSTTIKISVPLTLTEITIGLTFPGKVNKG